jgi:hypothetical protein
MLARAVESAWRAGALACFIVLLTSTAQVPNLDGKLALLAVFGVVCFLPRLDVTAVVGAMLATVYLSAASLQSQLSPSTAVIPRDLTLAWIALWLVVCANVQRTVQCIPERGLIDRDIAVILLGWLAAGQVCGFALMTAIDSPSSPYLVESTRLRLFRGEAALFLTAGATSVFLGMAALTVFTAVRARRTRSRKAFQAHPMTGAALSSLSFVILGMMVVDEIAGPDLVYEGFGAVLGAFVGLVVWAAFFALSSNEHLKTWGAIRALGLGLGIWLVGGLLVASAKRLDAWGCVAAAFLLWAVVWLCRDTWWRVAGIPYAIERGYAEAMERRQWLDHAEVSGLTKAQVHDARNNIRRVAAVHAAATGQGLARVLRDEMPDWRQQRVPDLRWMHNAAMAGRWHAFRTMPLLRDGAIDELTEALWELRALPTEPTHIAAALMIGER